MNDDIVQPQVQERSALEGVQSPGYETSPNIGGEALSSPEAFPAKSAYRRGSWRRVAAITLIMIGLVAAGGLFVRNLSNDHQAAVDNEAALSQLVKPQTIPLSDLSQQLGTIAEQPATLTVNGKVHITNSLVLQPATQPSNPAAGQIYYDQDSNALLYYNGTQFVALQGGTAATSSVTNNNVTNVFNTYDTVSGSNGNVLAQNGTAGDIAMFTGDSSISDSLLSQSGSALNFGGNAITVGTGSNSVAVIQAAAATGLTVTTAAASGSSGNLTVETGNSSTTAAGNVNIDTGTGIISGTVISDKTFEDGTDNVSDWYGDTIAQSSAAAHNGTYSLAVTITSNYWALGEDENHENLIAAATPGHEYSFTAWVRAGTVPASMDMVVYWQGSDTTIALDTAADTVDGWTELSGTAVAPAGTTNAIVEFISGNGVVGSVHYFDDIVITDLSSSSAISAVTVGAQNAESVTVGNMHEIGATSIQGSSGINVNGGLGTVNVNGGAINLNSSSMALDTSAGALTITSATTATWGVGTSTDGDGGDLTLNAGNGAYGNNNGGNLVLQPGVATGTGAAGDIVLGSDEDPNNVTIRGGTSAGNDTHGYNLTFEASNGTGAGGSGSILFDTAAPTPSGPQLDADSVTNGYFFGPNTFNVTVANQANRILMISLFSDSGDPASAVTDNGTPMSLLDSDPVTGASEHQVYYLVAPPTGTNIVTVTTASSVTTYDAEAIYNVNQTTTLGSVVTDSGSTHYGSFITINETVPTSPNEIVFGSLAGNGDDLTMGSGQTRNCQGATSWCQTTLPSTTGSSTTISYTTDATNGWTAISVPIMGIANATPDTYSTSLDIDSSGNIGIDNDNPQYALDVSGIGNFSDGVLSPSLDTGDAATLQVGDANANAIAIGNATNNIQTTISGTALIKPDSGEDSATVFQIQNAAGAPLFTADSSTMTITVQNLVVSASLTVDGHIITGGSTPTYTAGAAACTSPTIAVSGTDTSGTVTIEAGSGCPAGGSLATINFAAAFTAAPHVVLTPGDAAALTLGAYVDDGTVSTAGFTLATTGTTTTGTTYQWNYLVTQ